MDNAFLAPSRRALLIGAGAAIATVACNDRSAQALTKSAQQSAGRRARPLSDFGVDRFATRDQWAAMRAAFRAAHAEGFDLVADPDANYRHDGPLMLDGVSLDGRGCTLTALSDGPQVLLCVGNRWRVANLRLLGAARTRSSHNNTNGIMIGDEGGNVATNFVLENVTVDAVAPGRGVGGAGFMFNSASQGHIIRPIVRNSLADGIHITNGSHELVFERPLSERTGDDGFAVVSYRSQGKICHSIRARDGVSRDSGARGCSVVGGRDVVYERFLVERSAAAGAYFYSEDAYDTLGVLRCSLIDPVLRGCSTGRGLSPGFSNAALIIGGREGSDTVQGASVARGAVDCVATNPVVEGAGPACTAGISTHKYAVRPRILGGRLSNLVPTSGSMRTCGVEVGGQDVVIDRIRMNNTAGPAIVVTRTASGTCMINRPEVSGSASRPGPINSFVYADPAPALRQMTVQNGRFTKGPGRLATTLLSPGRLRLIGNTTR